MKYTLLLFLILYTSIIKGQNLTKIDSLHKVYQNATTDTTQILALVNIAHEYGKAKNDTCIHIARQSLKKSKELNYQKGEAKSLNVIARMYFQNRNYNKAILYFQQSLRIREASNNKKEMAKLNHNIGLSYFRTFQYSLSNTYFTKSRDLYQATQNQKGSMISLYFMGINYNELSKSLKAIQYLIEGMKLAEAMNNEIWLARIIYEIGNAHFNQKNYQQALNHYQQALAIQERKNNKSGIGVILNSISNVYATQGKLDLALEYYYKSLKIKEELNDQRRIALTLYNIGRIYRKQGKYKQALEYNKKCLAIGDSLKNKKLRLYGLQGISQTFRMQKEYEKSITYGLKSLALAQEIESLTRIRFISNDLYDSYKNIGNFVEALKYHEMYKESSDSLFNVNKSKAIANLESKAEVERKEKEIAILNKNQQLLEKDNKLQQIETERQRNAKLALEKQAEAERLLALARQEKDKRKQDSLQSLAQQTQLEADRLKAHEKQLEAESKARKLEVIKEREAKEFQQYINYLVIAGLISMLIFAFFIYRSQQKERKAKQQIQAQQEEIQEQNVELKLQKEELQVMNEELQQQSEEIIVQRDYIEEQNKHLGKVNTMLTGNIKVARTIQDAVLPYEEKFQAFFQDYFIFNKPRDIVSGDFYWLEKVGKQIFLVVADCTGHGVSGAFMSMIGSMMLDRIILNRHIFDPAEILQHLHQEIRKSLKQDISKNQSGMDLSLVRIIKKQDTFEVCFSGAKNDVLYFDAKTQKIRQVKATRKSIGGEQNENKMFEQETINLTQNSILYLGSDGLQDQNDIKRKRFGKDKLIQVFEENTQETLMKQAEKLREVLEKYMQDTEQRDDILWVGVKV